MAFVQKVTKEGSSDFVLPNERVATFDNDGTLWTEQPLYFVSPVVSPSWVKMGEFVIIREEDQSALTR